MQKRLIYPDTNSWLSEALSIFFRSFQNEYSLSLWEALNEYVGYHNKECAYLGQEYSGELELYPQISFDEKTGIASLDRIYFLSPDPKTIVTHNYLSGKEYGKDKSSLINYINKKFFAKPSEEYPKLNFMVVHNNMEPAVAKEILLQTSYNRNAQKKNYILRNEAEGIEYKSINITKIRFDLSLLENCSFLKAIRYASFKELLSPDLMVDISVRMEFNLPDLPKNLIDHEMLSITTLNES
ncbi:hypothetical protein MHF_0756 [Mycoplasma haemofelis Ohio2]|uniref:Uncharacterized protein n=1 Tax=Mycoplasma haemofelis (strain Ohio2) TaxID=859194 RepID=F6FIH8_MYCHI|nr:hypothetical protein MHF_0756 [Mycoplasma haemofelis Ohio2]